MLEMAPSAAGDMSLSQVARAASDPSSPIISGGKRLLSGLFGSGESAVTDAISAASGLRANTASTVMALAAPMVMSFLSKRVRADGMNMRGLGNLLERESGAIRSALPAGLADTFWPSTVKTATPVVAQTIERERSSFNWLPLLALAVLVPVILWLVHQARRPVLPAVAPVTTQTTPMGTANRVVVGSVDLVRRGLMNKTDLRFDTGSAQLRPESQAMLDTIATVIKRYPDVRINVVGYTDNVGSADKNIQLSQARAKTVVTQLVRRGVPSDCLTAEAHGEENPIDNNSTDVGRARNRRVSLDIRQP
jgi:OmpA-OmpF porin, OOP family